MKDRLKQIARGSCLLFGLFWGSVSNVSYGSEAEPTSAAPKSPAPSPTSAAAVIPLEDVAKKSVLQPHEAHLPKDAEGHARALRKMAVHSVDELGLKIWIEDQPSWDVELQKGGRFPVLAAQSPVDYHPPTGMTFMSLRGTPIAKQDWAMVTETALRRASQNYGLSESRSRSAPIRPASYGILQGYEMEFTGRINQEAADVRLFIGRAPERFPVALSIYTQADKLADLHETIRRSWTTIEYLSQNESKAKN